MPRKLATSFEYALKGIKFSFKTQRNLRIHFLIGLGILGLGWGLKISVLEFLLLILTIAMVMAVEMINTSVEEVVNLVVPSRHGKAEIAKDVAAGSVLVVSLFAVIIGALVFLPRLSLLWK